MGEDTLVTIIAIFLAAILMFVVPMITLADKTDNTTQVLIQTEVDEFVREVSKSGVITKDSLESFKSQINSTGNVYDFEIEVKVLDDASIKKTEQGQTTQIGENNYYTEFTTTIEDTIYNSSKKQYTMKSGDMITIKVRNTSQTFAESLRNVWAKITGNEASTLSASSSAMVTANGK